MPIFDEQQVMVGFDGSYHEADMQKHLLAGHGSFQAIRTGALIAS